MLVKRENQGAASQDTCQSDTTVHSVVTNVFTWKILLTRLSVFIYLSINLSVYLSIHPPIHFVASRGIARQSVT